MNEQITKPHFFLEVLNGCSAGAFGIVVYLNGDRNFRLFEQYSTQTYDHRKDLFRTFVNAENRGLLTFSFEIQNGSQTSWYPRDNPFNKEAVDCRDWIWEYNSMRLRVQNKESEPDTGGNVIQKIG